jgi:hypothetical protein
MSGEDFLVCVRDDAPQVIPGSTRATCARCGADVAVAPTGQRLRAERNLTVVCVSCIADVDDLEFEPLSAEQLAELRAYYARWQ